ncbi:xanthine dehydrogenase family protein molybdopterin-binding subunit [Neorhizobium petrolearium]|uniref:Xanthine dehydrogenase family protein molybdopterin-binding subunit n=1 Tax=Neorhizobium petrolearium TaxID=515361 RepID=A0ABY8MAJ0_9HYPH|nr:xanthine dehydrogenase family protein molybdopterin-binding subunit [Neorhizobium petrolearium]MCC2614039.1 xanthine dehydrogenase family protein molybdopterin-binding subunit [Neorhizobium petrolearium]WGI71558.1 xanthine dehydrogenase family protein molybdopterin-binding subunit [Neorhizobium petrolearium]
MLKIGQSQLRFEDDALITGRGRYMNDLAAKGEAMAVFVRSQAASGRIVSIDTEAAIDMPEVLGIFTGADLKAAGLQPIQPRGKHPGPDGGEMRVPVFYPLAVGAVRYVGDPIAMVVAETKEAALAAAEAVTVEIEERSVVIDPLEAVSPDAPLVWDEFPDNRCFTFETGDKAGVSAAIASAHTVVRQRLRISRVTAAPIETRGAIASYDDAAGLYRLELGTQAPHRISGDVAPILGVSSDKVHVVASDCGGSFGMKNAGYPEYPALLWAAKRTGRTIRWAADRLESFQSDAHARDMWADAALALDADGKFLGLDVHVRANLGAYLGPATVHPPVANIGGLAGVYRTPKIYARIDGVFTNTQQTAPYRGAGRPEATYIIERMIDLAAYEMGIDRAELRRRNLVPKEAMPYSSGFIFTYDSGDFPGVLDKALEMADWSGFEARRVEAKARGKLRGIGIANPIEIAGGPAAKPNPEFARVEIAPSGKVRIHIGSMDSGQGHGTAFRQVIADRLGLDTQDMEIVTGDTHEVPQGTGTFGSRTLAAAGGAIWTAADTIIEKLRDQAAEQLEAAKADILFESGQYRIAGTDRTISFAEVIAGESAPLSAENFVSNTGATFPNGCHICEVEIDPVTGQVQLTSYTVVDDVGRMVNPLLVKGQITGGVAQGLGQALMENAVYDPNSGQLLSATFMDYAMPHASDMAGVEIAGFSVPTQQNPLGVKGAGEAGTVGALSAVISAVADALHPLGVRHIDMPATPERVWRCLQMQHMD